MSTTFIFCEANEQWMAPDACTRRLTTGRCEMRERKCWPVGMRREKTVDRGRKKRNTGNVREDPQRQGGLEPASDPGKCDP